MGSLKSYLSGGVVVVVEGGIGKRVVVSYLKPKTFRSRKDIVRIFYYLRSARTTRSIRESTVAIIDPGVQGTTMT